MRNYVLSVRRKLFVFLMTSMLVISVVAGSMFGLAGSVAKAEEDSFVKIASFSGGALAISADGELWAYGKGNPIHDDLWNPGEENPDGTYANCLPQGVDYGSYIDDHIAYFIAADNRMFALTTTNKLYGWGDNGVGTLGFGDWDFMTRNGNNGRNYEPRPIPAFEGKTIISIVQSNFNVFAITDANELYAWGFNYLGMFGNAGDMPIFGGDSADSGGFDPEEWFALIESKYMDNFTPQYIGNLGDANILDIQIEKDDVSKKLADVDEVTPGEATITVTFDTPMREESGSIEFSELGAGAASLRSLGVKTLANASLSEDGRTLSLTVSLKEKTSYALSLADWEKSLFHGSLTSSVANSLSFKVGVDTTKKAILNVNQPAAYLNL